MSLSVSWPRRDSRFANYRIPQGLLAPRQLIWRSLKTDKISVAKTKLGDVEKEEQKKAEAGFVKAKDKVLIEHCIAAYREKGFRPAKPRNQKDVKPLKPAAVAYYAQPAQDQALFRSHAVGSFDFRADDSGVLEVLRGRR